MSALQTHAVNGHAVGFEHLPEGDESRVENGSRAAREVGAPARQVQQRQLPVLTTASSSLRGPLETMRRAAALLEHAHGDSALLSRLQHIIETQLAHLSTLIDEAQDAAGANARDTCDQRGTVDLIDLLCLAVARSRSTLAARGQVLVRQAPRSAPRVRGDAVRLRQAFSRLLIQASAHMPPGSEITLLTQEHAETVAVTVADGGFAAGSQSPCDGLAAQRPQACATSRGNHASGAGLAEVREVIRAYGGSIDVSSSDTDRFGAFVVTLPKV